MTIRKSLGALRTILPFAMAFAAIVGCTDGNDGVGEGEDGSGGADPSGESPDGPGSEEGGGQNGGPTGQCTKTWDETLVARCNYLDTYAANMKDHTPAGDIDPYHPTESCRTSLAYHIDLSTAWNGKDKAEAKEAILTAVHTMFFHPLLIPADFTFMTNKVPDKFGEGQMRSIDAKDIPANYDNILSRKTFNEGLYIRFVGGIKHLEPASFSAHMKTSNGGLVEVDESYARTANHAKNISGAAIKYLVARSLYHELRHTEGKIGHTSCSKIYENEDECDDDLVGSGYGDASQFGQALNLGALYTRRPGVYASVYPEPALYHVFYSTCRYAITKVNDFAINLSGAIRSGDPCLSDGTIWQGMAQMQVKPAAGGPLTPPGTLAVPDAAWTCADSQRPAGKD